MRAVFLSEVEDVRCRKGRDKKAAETEEEVRVVKRDAKNMSAGRRVRASTGREEHHEDVPVFWTSRFREPDREDHEQQR